MRQQRLRKLAVLVVVGLIGHGGAASAGGAYAPAPERPRPNEPTLARRCYSKTLRVPTSLRRFRRTVERWIATCVSSRTRVNGRPVRRERALVRNNASLLAVWQHLDQNGARGRPARIHARYSWRGRRVERIRFTTSFREAVSRVRPRPPKPRRPAVDLDMVLAGNKPLPRSLYGELAQATAYLTKLLDSPLSRGWMTSAKRDSIRCYLRHATRPSFDDRVVLWSSICKKNFMLTPDWLGREPARPGHGGIDRRGCSLEWGKWLKENIRSKKDVERFRSGQVKVVRHLRPRLLEFYRAVMEGRFDKTETLLNMSKWHGQMLRATGQLDSMANNKHTGMPRHYVAIRAWIHDQQQRRGTLYGTCF